MRDNEGTRDNEQIRQSIPKKERQQRLLVGIKKIFDQHEDNSNYGVQRILLGLSQADIKSSYSTVYRIMKKYGILKKAKRYPNGITREDAAAQKSENLIQRDFKSSTPNQKWLSDNARNARGIIYHSDRGSQFISHAFRECLVKRSAIQSNSGTGRCYDNARMESFFATLKKEKLYKMNTERYSMTYIKSIIFRYITVYQQAADLHHKSRRIAPSYLSRKNALTSSVVTGFL
ncbi:MULTISPECIES: IS3 family transposase [unclassified Paenibacillus]|uniref:IS3 family transposase n=1 Tax=unclassified Paenibacillus TaxID=185978 RepID=UPI00089865FB|nr:MULTISPECIES: IS3 family transposase [unclassified Paenibacillus]SDW16765.1 HTH-like domain-containing protein [Paenibacillus sp. PDC88]